MKKLKIPIKEGEIQHAILEMLAWCTKRYSLYVMRTNSFSGKFTRPNGSSGYIRNNKKGCPDIVLCKNGLWIGLEVKAEEGRQSPDQKIAEKDIRLAGGHYFIVRSVEDVEKILECY